MPLGKNAKKPQKTKLGASPNYFDLNLTYINYLHLNLIRSMRLFTLPGEQLEDSLRKEKHSTLAHTNSQEVSGKSGKWKCLLSISSPCHAINSFISKKQLQWLALGESFLSPWNKRAAPQAGTVPTGQGGSWQTQHLWMKDTAGSVKVKDFTRTNIARTNTKIFK